METTNVNHFLVLLGRTSLEAGILVVLVLATQWLFRKQLTPAWRCALWLLVAVRLLLPFSFSSVTSVFNLLPGTVEMKPFNPAPMTPMAPSVRVTTDWQATTPVALNNARETGGKTISTDTAPMSMLAPVVPAKEGFAWSWPVLIFTIWLTGALVLGGHVAVSSFRLWRLCVRLPIKNRAWTQGVLRECCERLRLRHPPVLLESCEVGSPALHGLFRPRLLLPMGFTEKFSPAELRFVFLHEIAHLKRRDLLMNWIVVLLQVVHWFNPLVWFGFSRWRAERELACDAMALEAAGEGQNKEYGRTILRLLDNYTRPLAAPGVVGILEDKRLLHRRIGMIASYVPTRGWPRLAVALIGALAVIGLTDPQARSSSAAGWSANLPPPPPPAPPSATTPVILPSTSPTVDLADLPPAKVTPTSQPQIILNTTEPQPKGNDMNLSSMTNQLARTAAVGLIALATSTTPAVQAADSPASVATSELANQLKGAWVLVGTPDHVGKAPSAGGRIKFFTGSHWCITQADAKTGVVLFHHGGTYTVNGNTFHANLEFADASTMNLIGHTNGNFMFKIEGDTLTSLGIDNPWNEVWKRLKPADSKSSLAELAGTWVYAGKPGETNAAVEANVMKFCAGGYWCDSDIDAKTGVVVVHHGGISSMKGDQYIETCQYGNPTSLPLIGQDVKFDMKVEGDTLTLVGIKNPWNEVWKRAD